MELFLTEPFYPAGDELVLTRLVTSRVVPERGTVREVRCALINIEEALDILAALEGTAVTDRYLTVTGKVKEPLLLKVPIGTRLSECLAAAQAEPDTALIVGGPMARYFGCELVVADVGIATPYRCAEVRNCNIAKGTKNLAKEPAMTRAETIKAVLTGAGLASEAARDRVDVIGIGEMGIGNTTTSSAVLAALTGLPAEAVTGRGGGVTDEGFKKKKEVIKNALKRHGDRHGVHRKR